MYVVDELFVGVWLLSCVPAELIVFYLVQKDKIEELEAILAQRNKDIQLLKEPITKCMSIQLFIVW